MAPDFILRFPLQANDGCYTCLSLGKQQYRLAERANWLWSRGLGEATLPSSCLSATRKEKCFRTDHGWILFRTEHDMHIPNVCQIPTNRELACFALQSQALPTIGMPLAS